MPFTFRFIFHSLRGVWLAILMAVLGYLTLVPATQAEKAALGNHPLATSPIALAQMRIARLVVHVAPAQAATMVSYATGGEISPELAGMLLRDIANGPRDITPQAEAYQPVRSAGGAKFVTVD